MLRFILLLTFILFSSSSVEAKELNQMSGSPYIEDWSQSVDGKEVSEWSKVDIATPLWALYHVDINNYDYTLNIVKEVSLRSDASCVNVARSVAEPLHRNNIYDEYYDYMGTSDRVKRASKALEGSCPLVVKKMQEVQNFVDAVPYMRNGCLFDKKTPVNIRQSLIKDVYCHEAIGGMIEREARSGKEQFVAKEVCSMPEQAYGRTLEQAAIFIKGNSPLAKSCRYAYSQTEGAPSTEEVQLVSAALNN